MNNQQEKIIDTLNNMTSLMKKSIDKINKLEDRVKDLEGSDDKNEFFDKKGGCIYNKEKG